MRSQPDGPAACAAPIDGPGTWAPSSGGAPGRGPSPPGRARTTAITIRQQISTRVGRPRNKVLSSSVAAQAWPAARSPSRLRPVTPAGTVRPQAEVLVATVDVERIGDQVLRRPEADMAGDPALGVEVGRSRVRGVQAVVAHQVAGADPAAPIRLDVVADLRVGDDVELYDVVRRRERAIPR